MEGEKVISVEYLKADTLPESVRIKNDLSMGSIVKATVVRNSPAVVNYMEVGNPISDMNAVFKNLRGKKF